MDPKRKIAFDVCTSLGLSDNSFDTIYINMWRNIREDGGYRLTEKGFEWLNEMGLKCYTITLSTNPHSSPDIKTGNILLSLDRQLKAPYFIKNNKLSIFDDSICTQLILYGGDIKAYLEATA